MADKNNLPQKLRDIAHGMNAASNQAVLRDAAADIERLWASEFTLIDDLGADAVGLMRRFDLLGSPLRAAVPDSKTPNTELVDKTSEKLRRQVDKMPETPIRRPAIENDAEKMLRLCADDPMWAEHAEVSKPLLLRAADELASLRKDAHRFRKLLMQHKHWLGVFRCDPDGAPSDSLSHVELTALLDAMNGPELNF